MTERKREWVSRRRFFFLGASAGLVSAFGFKGGIWAPSQRGLQAKWGMVVLPTKQDPVFRQFRQTNDPDFPMEIRLFHDGANWNSIQGVGFEGEIGMFPSSIEGPEGPVQVSPVYLDGRIIALSVQ